MADSCKMAETPNSQTHIHCVFHHHNLQFYKYSSPSTINVSKPTSQGMELNHLLNH